MKTEEFAPMEKFKSSVEIPHLEKTALLKVDGLTLKFPQFLKGLKETVLQVISDFTLEVYEGQIMGVVGASGSGKSLLADAIMGILPQNAILGGHLYFFGEKLSLKRQKALRGKDIFLIPQSIKSLDPLMKVGKQIQQVYSVTPITPQELKKTYQRLSLPKDVGNLYPYELSGGMARRILIAMAMISQAKLIIADEPTPGLDRKTRDEIIMEIEKLASEHKKGVLFITHDIRAALKIADKIAVFNEGKTLEIAEIDQFSGKGEALKNEYSRALWNALPENGFRIDEAIL